MNPNNPFDQSHFDLEVFKKRKELRDNSKQGSTTLNLQIEDDLAYKLITKAKNYGISVEDLVYDVLFQGVVQLEGNKENTDLDIIDSAYLSVHLEDLIDSKKNYLVINSENLVDKAVFVSKPEEVKLLIDLDKSKDKDIK